MIVNGHEYNLEELVKSLDTGALNMNKVGNFYLTNREMEILDRNFIEYRTCSSLKDLIMKIQSILEDEDLDADDGDDLDYVLETISERDYYQNTKK